MQEHLADILGEDRIVFAPPGVDVDRYTPGPPPSEGSYVLSVGRFADPRKNASLLVEAYAALREQNPGVPPLVLAGRTPPPEAAWVRADELGVRSQVTFHKDVSIEELLNLYRHASLYVVSSDEEGLGLTILEAMACGRPVVSTQCGGPSTTVVEGETGYLVPVGDASALATAMRDVLSDPETANRMGQRGRARVERHFSAAATGQRFLDVYDQLLNPRA
jgi:glycosyltransferase involved in cell wall biosynthesis